MLRLILFICAALIAATPSVAQTRKSWGKPLVVKNPHNLNSTFFPTLNITKVDFSENSTILEAIAKYRGEYIYGLGPDVHLVADGKSYHLQKSEGLELGDSIRISKPVRFKMFFERIPDDVNEFDLTQKRFNITGISDGEKIRKQILPSNWRDISDGRWIIGIYPEGLIYNGELWQYSNKTPDEKMSHFDITDGKRSIKVKIGKLRDGKRVFNIDGTKYVCDMIEGSFLPVAPYKDTTSKIIDNGYVAGDSVTVKGWLRNMPEWAKKLTDTYTIGVYGSPFSQPSGTCKIDSLGFFTIKMPLVNSALTFMDWSHTFIRNILEPGEEYFFIHDYDNGRILWMGNNARLQNELSLYPPSWSSFPKYLHPELDRDQYLSEFDKRWKGALSELDSICTANPNLSSKFHDVSSDILKANYAYDIGQSRFNLRPKGLSDTLMQYAYKNFFVDPPTPVAMNDYIVFISDFTQACLQTMTDVPGEILFPELKARNVDDKTMRILEQTDSIRKYWDPIVEAQSDPDRAKVLMDSIENEYGYLLQPLRDDKQFTETLNEAINYLVIKDKIAQLDSLNPCPIIRDIWLSNYLRGYLNNDNISLPKKILELARRELSNSLALESVEKLNNEFIELEQKRSERKHFRDSLQIQPVDITGLIDGKEILDKIMEPLKGRIVLMDIWGTWCAPCREGLSHTAELYKELEDLDVIYVYLANNSPEKGWLNVIDRYNIKGNNVVHYNLPANQQRALESYLEVFSFPTYKIVNPEGKMYDITISPSRLKEIRKFVEFYCGLKNQ